MKLATRSCEGSHLLSFASWMIDSRDADAASGSLPAAFRSPILDDQHSAPTRAAEPGFPRRAAGARLGPGQGAVGEFGCAPADEQRVREALRHAGDVRPRVSLYPAIARVRGSSWHGVGDVAVLGIS